MHALGKSCLNQPNTSKQTIATNAIYVLFPSPPALNFDLYTSYNNPNPQLASQPVDNRPSISLLTGDLEPMAVRPHTPSRTQMSRGRAISTTAAAVPTTPAPQEPRRSPACASSMFAPTQVPRGALLVEVEAQVGHRPRESIVRHEPAGLDGALLLVAAGELAGVAAVRGRGRRHVGQGALARGG